MVGTDTEFFIADTHAALLANGVDSASDASKDRVPAVAANFWGFYTDPATKHATLELQRHLTRLLTDTMYRSDPTPPQLIEAMAAVTAAVGAQNAARAGESKKGDRRGSPSSPSSSSSSSSPSTSPSTTELLFTTYPTSAFTSITTHLFQLALRHRLNLPVVDHLPPNCRGCGLPLKDDHSHFHSCTKRKKKGIYVRHEMIVQCLYSLARRAGLHVSKERAVRDSSGDKTVPDLKFHNTHLGAVHIDVSVVGSYAKSNEHDAAAMRAGESEAAAAWAWSSSRGFYFHPIRYQLARSLWSWCVGDHRHHRWCGLAAE